MAAPILVPCLVKLREEFNTLAPNRDKGADGWIGDTAHQNRSSDHNPDETGKTPYEDADNKNEVHALDIDRDLKGGLDLGDYVETIRRNHANGTDNRLQNIIYRGRIASRSWGWSWRNDASLGHYDHAHFSARYVTALESDTSSWGVYRAPEPEKDDYVSLSDDKIKLSETAGKELYEPDAKEATGANLLQLSAIWARRSAARVDSLNARIDALEEKLTAILEAVSVPKP